jgi:hypothetical protein
MPGARKNDLGHARGERAWQRAPDRSSGRRSTESARDRETLPRQAADAMSDGGRSDSVRPWRSRSMIEARCMCEREAAFGRLADDRARLLAG